MAQSHWHEHGLDVSGLHWPLQKPDEGHQGRQGRKQKWHEPDPHVPPTYPCLIDHPDKHPDDQTKIVQRNPLSRMDIEDAGFFSGPLHHKQSGQQSKARHHADDQPLTPHIHIDLLSLRKRGRHLAFGGSRFPFICQFSTVCLVGLVYLVCLVHLVCLVCLVCFVGLVYLVCLVDLVHLVYLVYLVCLVQEAGAERRRRINRPNVSALSPQH